MRDTQYSGTCRGLKDKLVNATVCAVDLTWSGLKLVIRKELR